jgi:hypothetical protein
MPFPEELSFRLPPKRKPWDSEDPRMGMFEAIALALMIHHQRRNQHRKVDSEGKKAISCESRK